MAPRPDLPPDTQPEMASWPASAPEFDPETLANIVLFGSSESRRRLAEHLAAAGDRTTVQLLAATVASGEPWQLRARCLEVLGMTTGLASREVAEEILASVWPARPPGAGFSQLDVPVPGSSGSTNLEH